MSRREATFTELKFFPLIGNRPQPLQQCRRVGIEIDEDEITKALTAHPLQATTGKVQIAKIFGVTHRQQLTLMVITPAVVLASQPWLFAAALGHHRCAAVAAGIVKCVNRSAFGMYQDYRLAGVLPQVVTARFRNLIDVPCKQP